MKDFLGKELNVDDKVIFTKTCYGDCVELRTGVVSIIKEFETPVVYIVDSSGYTNVIGSQRVYKL
jgi:hypothetical protein